MGHITNGGINMKCLLLLALAINSNLAAMESGPFPLTRSQRFILKMDKQTEKTRRCISQLESVRHADTLPLTPSSKLTTSDILTIRKNLDDEVNELSRIYAEASEIFETGGHGPLLIGLFTHIEQRLSALTSPSGFRVAFNIRAQQIALKRLRGIRLLKTRCQPI